MVDYRPEVEVGVEPELGRGGVKTVDGVLARVRWVVEGAFVRPLVAGFDGVGQGLVRRLGDLRARDGPGRNESDDPVRLREAITAHHARRHHGRHQHVSRPL
jgi:hypothetical protein